MLLHAWLLLDYLALASALLLCGTIAVICLRSEPLAYNGFLVSTDRRRQRRYHGHVAVPVQTAQRRRTGTK